MPTRNTTQLMTQVYSKLSGDATLQGLLGGAGRVKFGTPDNVAEYPCVTYYLLAETDSTYNIDQTGADVAASYFNVESFSVATGPQEINSIDDRVFELLHFQNLSDVGNGILVHLTKRESRAYMYEPDSRVHHIISRYKLVNNTV